MAEKCPLGEGLYWDNEYGEFTIPDICRDQCGELMEQATMGTPEYDYFETDCEDPIEYGGQSLQRGVLGERSTAILNISAYSGDDMFAEQYEFKCPYN